MPTKNIINAAVTTALFKPANMMVGCHPRQGSCDCGTDQGAVDPSLH
jgi:hypothetical protein